MGDYWWVFILVIFVIMLVYPTPPKRKDKFKNTKDILDNIKNSIKFIFNPKQSNIKISFINIHAFNKKKII